MKFLAFLIYRLKARMTFSVKAKEPPQKGDFSLSKAPGIVKGRSP